METTWSPSRLNTTKPNRALPLLATAQAQRHAIVNEALLRIHASLGLFVGDD